MRIQFIIILISLVYCQDYTYSLQDINTASDYLGEYISPSNFAGQVTLHYFGHQNWGACTARVGYLNGLHDDLLAIGINNVKIITIGKGQYSNYNNNWLNNNDLPFIVDPSPNNTWNNWSAGQRDLFFLDSNGNYYTHFNISNWDYDNIYNTIIELLPEDNVCDDIESNYISLHEGEYSSCDYNIDCISVWGDCNVGLGGCHYSVNANSYPENQINNFVNQWNENNCTEGVCDCLDLPQSDCINGNCELAYCVESNPVGCFEAGCPNGYQCIDNPNYCIPSSCGCDSQYGTWVCTEDCNGGVCQLYGDINNDTSVDVVDVVLLVDIILNNGSNLLGDINEDFTVDVIDVVLLVDIILGND